MFTVSVLKRFIAKLLVFVMIMGMGMGMVDIPIQQSDVIVGAAELQFNNSVQNDIMISFIPGYFPAKSTVYAEDEDVTFYMYVTAASYNRGSIEFPPPLPPPITLPYLPDYEDEYDDESEYEDYPHDDESEYDEESDYDDYPYDNGDYPYDNGYDNNYYNGYSNGYSNGYYNGSDGYNGAGYGGADGYAAVAALAVGVAYTDVQQYVGEPTYAADLGYYPDGYIGTRGSYYTDKYDSGSQRSETTFLSNIVGEIPLGVTQVYAEEPVPVSPIPDFPDVFIDPEFDGVVLLWYQDGVRRTDKGVTHIDVTDIF